MLFWSVFSFVSDGLDEVVCDEIFFCKLDIFIFKFIGVFRVNFFWKDWDGIVIVMDEGEYFIFVGNISYYIINIVDIK